MFDSLNILLYFNLEMVRMAKLKKVKMSARLTDLVLPRFTIKAVK